MAVDPEFAAKRLANQRRWWRERVYGITDEIYEQMLESQGNACACCRSPFGESRPHIDHDHETGLVRGLLCRGCNVGIGALGDDLEGVQRAAAYLARAAAQKAA